MKRRWAIGSYVPGKAAIESVADDDVFCDHCGRLVSGLVREKPPLFRRLLPWWVQRLLLIEDRTAIREAMRRSL